MTLEKLLALSLHLGNVLSFKSKKLTWDEAMFEYPLKE